MKVSILSRRFQKVLIIAHFIVFLLGADTTIQVIKLNE